VDRAEAAAGDPEAPSDAPAARKSRAGLRIAIVVILLLLAVVAFFVFASGKPPEWAKSLPLPWK
jgi:hypothetical protein